MLYESIFSIIFAVYQDLHMLYFLNTNPKKCSTVKDSISSVFKKSGFMLNTL